MKDILIQITQRIEEMPIVSETPYHLLKTITKDNYSIKEVISIIETDVSLTTQCLKTVNSAAFSLRQDITSIKQAVVLLGSKMLINIALAQTFKNIFFTSMKGYGANYHDFWEYSIRTALATRHAAEKLTQGVPSDSAYTAGLLHDIGKAIISEFLEKYEKELILEMISNNDGNFLKVEQDLLGTDHTLVGEAMAKKWNFPKILQDSIRYHHQPSQCKSGNRTLIDLVHIADLITMMRGSGTGIDSLIYEADPVVVENISLNKENFTNLVLKIDMEYIEIKKKFKSLIDR